MLFQSMMGRGKRLISIKGIELEFGDLVVATTLSGHVYKGVLSDFEMPEDSVSGYKEIEIRELVTRTLYEHEIVSIEKVV